MGHGMAFRSILLPYLIPFTENCGFDQWVALLALAAGRLLYVEEPLTSYRIHASQASDNRKRSLFRYLRINGARVSGRSEDEIGKLRDIEARVRIFLEYVPDSAYVLSVIEDRLNFLGVRDGIREAVLPGRLLRALSELLRGRYQRNSRGFLAFARDLYGSGKES